MMDNFKNYLKASRDTKIYIALSIFFALKSAASANNFILEFVSELIFWGLVTLGVSFIEYKIRLKMKKRSV